MCVSLARYQMWSLFVFWVAPLESSSSDAAATVCSFLSLLCLTRSSQRRAWVLGCHLIQIESSYCGKFKSTGFTFWSCFQGRVKLISTTGREILSERKKNPRIKAVRWLFPPKSLKPWFLTFLFALILHEKWLCFKRLSCCFLIKQDFVTLSTSLKRL